MELTKIPIRIKSRPARYNISIGSETLSQAGPWAKESLGRDPGKVLVVSNKKVSGLYGETLRSSLSAAGYDVVEHLIGDGERFKNLHTLQRTLQAMAENRLTRTDAVVALGGGVVGDLAGFAAAVHLRGIACLQVPTTLLAMIDSSVGGKTGVNTSFGKNLVGAFHQPAGVLIDMAALVTLSRRELTAGLCEAIKHAAISGGSLLKQTRQYLDRWPRRGLGRDLEQRTHLARLVSANVRFKAKIVQNDEIEAVTDISPQSRKILNFGHTFAHALEKVTDYKYLKHGEAVGHGIRFAAALSKRLELIDQDEVELLNDVLRSAGVLPAISHIDPLKVMEAFKHDKKQIGKSLNWILLQGIGKPVIVSGSDIPRSAITATLKDIIRE